VDILPILVGTVEGPSGGAWAGDVREGFLVARIRSIKPEFFTSRQLVECSTNARLLFVGTWVFADDLGRHKLCFPTLKMEVFPGDAFSFTDVEAMFDELWKAGLVDVYQLENQRYFRINGWHHQKIDKPQKPRCPNPDECQFVDHSSNGSRTVGEHSSLIRYDTILDDTIRDDTEGGKIRRVTSRHVASVEKCGDILGLPIESLASKQVEPLPLNGLANGDPLRALTAASVDEPQKLIGWFREQLALPEPFTGSTGLDLLLVVAKGLSIKRGGKSIKNPAAVLVTCLRSGEWLRERNCLPDASKAMLAAVLAGKLTWKDAENGT